MTTDFSPPWGRCPAFSGAEGVYVYAEILLWRCVGKPEMVRNLAFMVEGRTGVAGGHKS